MTQWWKSAVVYQVYPRSFADTDGDGMGDLRGVIDHLDYLETLGVDVIWLCPVYASPQDDNGYDISDYYAVDPGFGTLADLDELTAGLHSRGMKLVMDLVVNHTSDEHPWFAESRSSRENPKRDWYLWRDARDGREPNNWRSFFSGSAWQWDEASGQYFLHLFSKKQPDLNWENPEVRSAIYRMMNWWLDRGIDGFRMDVINFLSKTPDLPDASPTPGAEWVDGSEHFASGPRIHEFLQEMNRAVFAGRTAQLVKVGEMPHVRVDQARLFTDPARSELDMVFQFEHVEIDHGPTGRFSRRPLDLVALKKSFARWQEALADTGWNSLYWNNHDQPRVVSRFGDARNHWYSSATALATVLHLQRGTPYIYQGEELGMTNTHATRIDQLRDLESLNYYAASSHDPEVLAAIIEGGRDNARTPMQWDATEHAGFTDGDPWIEVNPNHSWLNAAAQRDDPASVFAWYRRLIQLRHTDPVVVHGRFRLLAPDDPQVFAFTRTTAEAELLVVANCSSTAAETPRELGKWSEATLVLSNHDDLDALPASLAPWDALVLRRDIA